MGWKFYNSTGQLLVLQSSATADTATVATTVTVTDNESTNENNVLTFVANADADGGNVGLESDGTLHYNPSTGTVTATAFAGNLTGNVTGNTSGTAGSATGNAATATALASARTIGGVSFDGTGNITLPGVNSAGNQATSGLAATATLAATTTALASARTIGGVSFDGTGNITLPGVNSSGNQNTSGTAAGLSATLAVASGGTNLSSYTTGDIVYASGSTALSKLAKGDEDQVLTMGGSSAPTWADAASGLSAASEAQMEAASVNTVAVTPGRTQHHPGVAKVWCQRAGDGTLNSPDYGVGVVDDDDTGDATVNFTTPFTSGVYCVLGGFWAASFELSVVHQNIATTSVRVLIGTPALGVLTDANTTLAIFGIQ